MTRKRRSFTADFKARVALEAIKNQHTLQEIASRFEVHPNQVAQWKRQALESLPEVFSTSRVLELKADEELRDQLYQQIGRLQVELEWLKKSRGSRVEHPAELDRACSSLVVDFQPMRPCGNESVDLVLPSEGGKRGESGVYAPAG